MLLPIKGLFVYTYFEYFFRFLTFPQKILNIEQCLLVSENEEKVIYDSHVYVL